MLPHFLFFFTKNLGAYGDGGMITTNNARIGAITKGLRTHGSGTNGRRAFTELAAEPADLAAEAETAGNPTVYDPAKYYNYLIGVNSRLDTWQAAILNVKLNHLGR